MIESLNRLRTCAQNCPQESDKRAADLSWAKRNRDQWAATATLRSLAAFKWKGKMIVAGALIGREGRDSGRPVGRSGWAERYESSRICRFDDRRWKNDFDPPGQVMLSLRVHMIVWAASYPRSGNSLLRTLLYQHFGVQSFADESEQIAEFTDAARAMFGDKEKPADWYEQARHSSSLTLVKTHRPPLDDSKAIYVVRDGRNTIDSYHKFPHLRDPFHALAQTSRLSRDAVIVTQQAPPDPRPIACFIPNAQMNPDDSEGNSRPPGLL